VAGAAERVVPESRSHGYRDFKVKVGFGLPNETGRVAALVSKLERGERVAIDAAHVPGAAAVSRPRELRGGTHAIDVVSKAPPLDGRSQDLVRDLHRLGDAVEAVRLP